MLQICEKKTIYNTNVDLVNDDEHTKFGLILSICCQEKTSSIKGRNSVANSRKTMIYITNVDLVNDYMYTKFGLNRPICFLDIEQKLNYDINQGL